MISDCPAERGVHMHLPSAAAHSEEGWQHFELL